MLFVLCFVPVVRGPLLCLFALKDKWANHAKHTPSNCPPTCSVTHAPTWLWLVCLSGQVRMYSPLQAGWGFRFSSLNRWHLCYPRSLGRASIWRSRNVRLGCNWAMPESPQNDTVWNRRRQNGRGERKKGGTAEVFPLLGRTSSELLMLISWHC